MASVVRVWTQEHTDAESIRNLKNPVFQVGEGNGGGEGERHM